MLCVSYVLCIHEFIHEFTCVCTCKHVYMCTYICLYTMYLYVPCMVPCQQAAPPRGADQLPSGPHCRLHSKHQTPMIGTYHRATGIQKNTGICTSACAHTHTDKPVRTETKYNSHTPIPPKPPVVCIGTCLP